MFAEDRSPIPDPAYVCPLCRRPMQVDQAAYVCPACRRRYPINDGIPDFILENLEQSTHPILRGVKSIDRLARYYESRLWYPVVLNVYGGLRSATLPGLIKAVSAMLNDVSGRILDAACGPSTYGRHLASPARVVYGIDISTGMLRQGAVYLKRQGVDRVYLARSRVETLPFTEDFFDGALCCGALHLFADPTRALREIARTLAPGAPLAVITFIAGRGGIFRFERLREHAQKAHGVHIFTLTELDWRLSESGFTGFQPQVSGSILTFCARKAL